MSLQRLEDTTDQNESLELRNGIDMTQHARTNGIDIRRSDYGVFSGGPVIIPHSSLTPVAEVLIEESPRDASAWTRVMLRHLSQEEKANLAKDLIDEVAEKERGDDEG